MMKKIVRVTAAAVVTAASLAGGFMLGHSAASAAVKPVTDSPGTQFVVYAQAGNRILSTHPLWVGEVLHVGLDGFPVTVIADQQNGGEDVAWVSPFLFSSYIHKHFVVTVG